MSLAAPRVSRVSLHEDPQYRSGSKKKQKLIARYQKRPDMSWRDHLAMLLSFGAAAEHCLMVQYLYAAYSMRTGGESHERASKIEAWRSQILAVAREEMGHLLTVQNLLLLLGAPTALDRDNSVVGAEILSLSLLARAAVARDPGLLRLRRNAGNQGPVRRLTEPGSLIKMVRDTMAAKYGVDMLEIKADVHRVGALYEEIIELISDEQKIPDSAFDAATFEFQASFDEWGRNYKPAPYKLEADGSRDGGRAGRIRNARRTTADVLVRLELVENGRRSLRAHRPDGDSGRCNQGSP